MYELPLQTTVNARSFPEMLREGERFLAFHRQLAHAMHVTPGGVTFWADWDAWCEANGKDYTDTELRAICSFAQGALGIAKRRK